MPDRTAGVPSAGERRGGDREAELRSREGEPPALWFAVSHLLLLLDSPVMLLIFLKRIV